MSRFALPKTAPNAEVVAAVRQIHIIALALMAIVTAIIPLMIWAVPASTSRWLLIGVVINLIGGAVWWISSKVNPKVVSFIMIGGLWLLITYLALTAGGIQAPTTVAYLILILMAGLLLGDRAGIVTGIICGLTGFSLAILGSCGRLPPNAVTYTTIARGLSFEIYVLLTIVLQSLASRSVRDATRRTMQAAAARQQAELALNVSEAQFQATFQHAGIGIALVDSEGRPMVSNPALQHMLGYTQEELRIMPFPKFTHADDVPRDWGLYQELITGKRDRYQIEKRYYHKSGRLIWARLTVSLVRKPGGEPLFAIGMAEDITAQKAAESHVRHLTHLIDLSLNAIIIGDIDGTIRYWNKGAELLFGWTAAEAVGRKATELYFRDTQNFREAQEKLLATGGWKGERRHVAKNGQELVIESHLTLVRDQPDQPLSVLVVDIDITEKKRLEEQFFRMQRLESVGALAGGVAHDLNNILAPILIAPHLLRKKFREPAERRILDMIEASAGRGAQIVSQILLFSRGLRIEKTPLQSRSIIKETLALIQETFPRAISLQTDVSLDLWALNGDATQLYQVLVNLCINSRDAMPEGGTLTVRAENVVLDDMAAGKINGGKPGSYVRWSVIDTGSGIPAEHMAKLFEPFFTTKEPGRGTGLGLSTVLAILKNHDGFFDVQSQVGKGTQFHVYLPASESPQDFVPPLTRDVPSGQGQLVLVVDDEYAVRNLIETTLAAYNYRVLAAETGQQALEIFHQHTRQIAAAVIDFDLPGMNGAEAARLLRGLNPKLKIVMTSGTTDEKKSRDAASSRIIADAFLQKPFSSEQLLDTLHGILTQPGLGQ
ncbi:MAG TPA: PAS domain S-box protein [Opitutaceae bacterium]|nr:PAS domain S-box protein [Opitutaceae bacterium]